MEKKYIKPYRLFTGAFIPNWLLRRKEISAGAKLCYARLCQYAGKDGICFPAQDRLAEEIGTNKRQIRRFLNELENFKLIEIEQLGKKLTNRYKFLWHTWISDNITNIPEENTYVDICDSERTNCPLTAKSERTNTTEWEDNYGHSIERESLRESLNTINTINTSSQVKRTCDPVAINLSKFLLTEILKNNPSSRLHSLSVAAQETTITRWARDMDLLIRKDRQEPSTVEEVIRYCTADGFWGANILSGKKLREKWDTLTAQLKRPKNQRKEVADDARFNFLKRHSKSGSGIQDTAIERKIT